MSELFNQDSEFKKLDSSLISGYPICHNYIILYMSFDGKTRSEIYSIEIKGKNKWQTIIQNATVSKE